MAELAFVDTHFHLHDMKHPKLRYAWLEPDAVHGFLPDTDPLKAQRYRIKDYLAEIRFANVAKAIHVQAAVNTPDPVAETEWLQGFADETGFPQGIVAECHLARPDAAQVIDRHLVYANLRGIRDFGEGRYLVDPHWRRGFAELAPRNLVSCIDTRVELAPDLVDLARAFPDTVICVDHCAIPMARDPESFRQWRAAMSSLANSPNVVMKISGLGMCDPRWTVASIGPYVLGAIDAFGCDRVVFATNWPVDRMFSSYPDVVNAYAEIITPFTREERTSMFSGNAERIFRI
jgi:predicted TIM-barrel fold metal-dependent hydrolase